MLESGDRDVKQLFVVNYTFLGGFFINFWDCRDIVGGNASAAGSWCLSWSSTLSVRDISCFICVCKISCANLSAWVSCIAVFPCLVNCGMLPRDQRNINNYLLLTIAVGVFSSVNRQSTFEDC